MTDVKKFSQSRWKLVLTIFTFAAFVLLVIALRHQIVDTLETLSQINAWILIFMVVWQGLSYYSYTRLYQGLFVLLGERIRFRSMFRVSLELNFINNILPSGGVSTFSYFGIRMRDADVPPSKSAIVQVGRFILIFVSFEILLLLGLLMLAIGGNVNNVTMLICGSLATVLVIGTLGLGFVVSSKRRIDVFFTYMTRQLNKLIHVFRPKYPETISIENTRQTFTEINQHYELLKKDYRSLRMPLVWALLVNLAEVATIYTVYAAFGYWVNPGGVIIAYAVANFAGLISVLPGGIGIYEALMTATLAAAGIPASVSVPVTITYRILNMTIQLPPGYYYYYKALHRQNRP